MSRPIINLADPVNRQHPLNRGLVAWWMALPGLTGGSTLVDLMGRHHGTLTHAAPAQAWAGTSRLGGWGALDFSGGAEHVRVDAWDAIDTIDDFHASVWVYVRSLPADDFVFVLRQGSHNATFGSSYSSYVLILDNRNSIQRVRATVLFPGATRNMDARAPLADLPLHQWVLLSFSRHRDTVRLYQDGELVASDTAGDAGSQGETASYPYFTVGGGPAGRALDGRVDSVRLVTRDVPGAEIAADYDLSRRYYPGLLNRVRRPTHFLLSNPIPPPVLSMPMVGGAA